MPLAVAHEHRELCQEHTFHIPVMGTGYSLDTALRVAPFGIASVLSLVNDVLIEQLRLYHAARVGEAAEPIRADHPDARAARITAYLNLLDLLVEREVAAIRAAPFAPGSPLTRYFDLLPESPLKRRYRSLAQTTEPAARAALETELRAQVRAGSIDVNIMTQPDVARWQKGERLGPEFNDGMAALRGYAQSGLHSGIVFSAGLNPKLYTYLKEFTDFLPDATGYLKKRIILKVSDFRSASVQARFLAKRGLWVSEYRIESGLNCGGHAFAAKGNLLGPTLAAFRAQREELAATLHETYVAALTARGLPMGPTPLPVRLTVQGGIGTHEEDEFLRTHCGADGTGWATPFLLAPDVTNVDEEVLNELLTCKPEDVFLSDHSPLGVPFWNLRQSPSEVARAARVNHGRPGVACHRGYARTTTEYGPEQMCMASHEFQKRKLAELAANGLPDDELQARRRTSVLNRACICHDLGGGVLRKYGIDPSATSAICPGPNLVYFRKRTNLDEMVSHIYGRLSLLSGVERPHMFIKELQLNVAYLAGQLEECAVGLLPRVPGQLEEVTVNLEEGIRYYYELASRLLAHERDQFLRDLAAVQEQVQALARELAASATPVATPAAG